MLLIVRSAVYSSILLLGTAAWAQITTGSLSGTVSDPAGAVIPSAKIEVKSQNTAVVQELKSNESGSYKASFLTPGKYTVHVEAAGFKAVDEKDVEVQLGRDTLVNIGLQVGSVTDTVQVEGAAPLVESDTSQLSYNVDSTKVVNLPGVQGQMDKLALLSPGIVYGFGNINSNGLVFSANGQRARSNNFLLDGQDNNDPTIAGPGYFFSNLEAVGEFQVISNQFSAEYGRNAGAIVNTIVKSGTNSYHGTGTYLRRDDQNWTALDNIQRASGLTNPPKYLDTILAGQADGPIIKDKLFINGWLQREWGRSNSLSIGTGSTLMPTPAGLQQLATAFPLSISVQNLAKYGAWGTKLGTASIVPGSITTKPLVAPNGQTVNIEFSSVERAISQPQDNWDGGFKSDYRIGSKDTVTGKYYQQSNTFANAGSNTQAGYFYNNPGHSKQLGGSWIHTFNPTLINEFRFSFIKTGFYFEGGNTFPFADLTKNIANVSITGGYLGYGLATNLPQYRLVNSYQFTDNVNKQLGRHSLKMGVQYVKDNIPLGFLPAVNGQFIYPSFQAYVDNKPSQFNGAAGTATQEPKELDQSYYIQDDFKLRPNLTLNLGLRYEYSGQPVNLLNDVTTKRESNPATAIWDTTLPLSARTYPTLRAPSKNFAPRLGFAWSPGQQSGFLGKLMGGSGDTVVRGGFAISYDPSFYNLMLNAQTAAPVVYSYSLTGASVVPMPSDISGANLQTLFAPPKGVDPRGLNQTLFNPDFRSPYSESFSLGIQRRLGNRLGFEVRGVRTRAVAQFASRNGNPYIAGFINNGFANVVPSGVTPTSSSTCANCNGRVIPNYGNIRIRDNSGQSNYNGLQTSLNARDLLKQFTLGLSYTWSKTIDNVSEAYSFLGSGSILTAQNPFNVSSGEKGLSNNNIPHAFSMNMVWTMPWLKSGDRWINRLAGGWSMGLFDVWQAGRPMTVVQLSTSANVLSDTSYNGFAAGYDSARPFLANPKAPLNTVGTFLPNGSLVNFTNQTQTVAVTDVHWIYNTLAADKAFGTPFGVGRNTLTGPVFQRADISIYKAFAIKERLRLTIRAEATNAFNHVSYGVPSLYIDSGTATSFLNPTYTEAAPRIIKLGAKIVF
jgi:hypothetical protein